MCEFVMWVQTCAVPILKASAAFPNGIGQIARPSDTSGPVSPRVVPRRSIAASVAYVNAAQKWAREHTRLGIPILFHEESLHGFAAKDATAFPPARSEEHTSELQSLMRISYAVFCLTTKKTPSPTPR